MYSLSMKGIVIDLVKLYMKISTITKEDKVYVVILYGAFQHLR